MDELEALKKKKLAQLQEQFQQQQAEQAQLQQQVQALEQFVTARLSKQALERYGNIKAAHPEQAVQLLTILGQIIQTKNVQCFEDEQVKQVLQMMQQQKRDITIKRK